MSEISKLNISEKSCATVFEHFDFFVSFPIPFVCMKLFNSNYMVHTSFHVETWKKMKMVILMKPTDLRQFQLLQ